MKLSNIPAKKNRDVNFAFLVFIICLLISFSKNGGELLTAGIASLL